MAEKGIGIPVSPEMNQQQMNKVEAEKKKLEKPIKTTINIDTQGIINQLKILDETIKRVMKGNGKSGYELKIDFSPLQDMYDQLSRFKEMMSKSLVPNKNKDGEVINYSVRVSGLGQIRQSFDTLNYTLEQFRSQMESINARPLALVEEEMNRVNAAINVYTKKVGGFQGAPFEKFIGKLFDGTKEIAKGDANKFLSTYFDPIIDAGGKLPEVIAKGKEAIEVTEVLQKLKERGLIDQSRLLRYEKPKGVEEDTRIGDLNGFLAKQLSLEHELKKAQARQTSDFNVGFKQEDIDKITNALKTYSDTVDGLEGKKIGLSEEDITKVTDAFEGMKSVIVEIKELLSSTFDIPNLEVSKESSLASYLDSWKKQMSGKELGKPEHLMIGNDSTGFAVEGIGEVGGISSQVYKAVLDSTKSYQDQVVNTVIHSHPEEATSAFSFDDIEQAIKHRVDGIIHEYVVSMNDVQALDISKFSDAELHNIAQYVKDNAGEVVNGQWTFNSEEAYQAIGNSINNYINDIVNDYINLSVSSGVDKDSMSFANMVSELQKKIVSESIEDIEDLYDVVYSYLSGINGSINPNNIVNKYYSKMQQSYSESILKDQIKNVRPDLNIDDVYKKMDLSTWGSSGFDPFQQVSEKVSVFQEIKNILSEIKGLISELDFSKTQFDIPEDTVDKFSALAQNIQTIRDTISGSGLSAKLSFSDIFSDLDSSGLNDVFKRLSDWISPEATQDISEKFDSLKVTTKNVDNLLNFAAALETVGVAIKELSQTQGFQDTLAPINELLKNAEGLKSLSAILSSSTAKIKATQDQAAGKQYSANDYVSDIKNYYKYLEMAKTDSNDTRSQFIADQYLQKTLDYAEQINEKRRQGIALTDDELKAYAARADAQEKYLRNTQKIRDAQQEKKRTEREQTVNKYMQDTGTDSAAKIAQKIVTQNLDNQDSEVQSRVNHLKELLEQLGKYTSKLYSDVDKVDISEDAGKNITKFRREIKEATKDIRDMVSGQNIKMADEGAVARVGKNFESWLSRNPKAVKTYGDEIKVIQDSLSSNNLNTDQLKQVQAEIDNLIAKANQANNIGKTFSDTLKGSFGNLARYLMTFASFYQVINVFKQAINVVKELDSALTEMRKVSDESVSSLKDYQLKTFDMADKVGTTAVQIQNSTADWLRLGKSFEDAQNLATQSTVLLNVSEFKDIQSATEQLVSATQAYDELDASAITDKLNIIGNNFAVGTSDLAQGLQNAAAVLKTQGNDIDQALALLTAGNLIGQDISKQSAGVRTISLRIAGKLYARTYSNVWA